MAMVQMRPHFLEFSRFLNSNEVRYLLIGGYAVGYHGWARNTKEVDFWIAGDNENQARAVAAIRQFAFPRAGGVAEPRVLGLRGHQCSGHWPR